MKNIKTYNPIILARNAIAATGIMTILNIIIVALHFDPIFPLSLILPVSSANLVFNTSDQLIEIFGSLEKLNASRPFYIFVTVTIILLLVYSYYRSVKKPGAIKIGFGVILLDTIVLISNYSLSLTFLIDLLYHFALVYYVFKGIAALRAVKNG